MTDSSGRAGDRLILRIWLLIVVVSLVIFWLEYHLRLRIWEALTGGAFLTIVYSVAGTFVNAVRERGKATAAGDGELSVNVLWRAFGKTIRAAASVPVLVVLYLAALVPGSLFSSVTVMAAGEPGEREVRVWAEGGSNDGNAATAKKKETLKGDDGVVHFVVFTNPFGRPYALDVDGYQRSSFDLFPWVGARIRITLDLRRAPTVLVRVPVIKHSILPGATVELLEVTDGGAVSLCTQALDPDGKVHGSVFFGRPVAIPAEIVSRWERELRVGGLIPERPGFDRAILNWRRALAASCRLSLRPNMRLEARLRSRSGEVHASSAFRVTSEPLQDIMMHADPEA